MFGLGGALVLGFLDLQTGQAQNRFYNELEEWLSSITRLSSAGVGGAGGDQSVPAYVGALLEQTADSIDHLQRTISHGEESRASSNQTLLALSEGLATLTDSMRAEQDLMVKLAESQKEMKPVQSFRAVQPATGWAPVPFRRTSTRPGMTKPMLPPMSA